MKKIGLFLVLAAVSLTQSCMKCDHNFDRPKPHVTTDAVNASISENTTYSYTLPAMPKGSMSYVTTAPAHAGASTIVADANGNLIYSYTPMQNYTGNDVVVVTTSSEAPGGGPGMCNNNGGGHNCNHQGDDNTIITTINISVTSSSSVAAKPVATPKNIDF